MKNTMKFGRYTVEITHPEKVLFAKGKITKGDLIEYYARAASYMIPLVKDRPMMLHRFPDGITGESFYQKNAGTYFPEWIKRVKVPLKGEGHTEFVVCQNQATLVYLANQAMITPHIWLSRIKNLENPDRLIFDLDPSHEKPNFAKVCWAALLIKEMLEQVGLKPFVMTTGSHGLHVVVPLNARVDFATSRLFATHIAQHLVLQYPKELTMELRKEKRGSRIFIDTLRNQFGATGVAPYGVRAHPGAPVATPLHWDELSDKKLTSQAYNIKTIFERLDTIKDPWHTMPDHAGSISAALKKLKGLIF